MENKKILLLFAHPTLDRSEVNKPLFEAASQLPYVTAVDLYREYPKYHIDINREQSRLIEHDIVIFQFPLYWYSTPSILKEWQDLVLEYGFAYGSEGKALHGKTFLCAITAGGKEEAYRAEGYNHFTIRELLRPLEQTALLTGMHYLAPFGLFSSRTAVEENRCDKHKKKWLWLLEQLHRNTIDLAAAAEVEKLNHLLDSIYPASE
ncbi:NAD(P)H-dependent oxidoreductase [Catenovulum sp. SM1970]|uniref:NAD(P)H-dependent oxidoreductase n=1 Tax=Marinifaba aquimaris TaxID=2741323 RepID=UPI0015747367|nr:NAD(P)H-dependent oxidoreductase [Marinifaba aquimaris]NTS78103.1 NAD(P)H-dependent oxidoreductase [Marinifaba aquimaris]